MLARSVCNFAKGAILSSCSHRAPLVRSRFACAFPRRAESFAPGNANDKDKTKKGTFLTR
jgi:hypothetical protein